MLYKTTIRAVIFTVRVLDNEETKFNRINFAKIRMLMCKRVV